MVPEGWSDATLGELLNFKNGFNTDKSNYGHGTPFINVSEVLKNASLKAEQIPGMVRVTEKEASANAVVRGDILFNRTSETTDEVGFTSVYLDDVPVVFGGFVIRGRPINGDIHPEFGQYAMRQPMVRYEIIRRSQGAVRSNIGQGELSKVRVHLPPLAEQRKIADILSTWDQAIEKTEALLSNARTEKRALMQQLLTGKRRFPTFEGQPWKEVRLGDVVKIDWGNTSITKKSYVDSGVDAYSAAGQDGFVTDAEFSGTGIVLSAIGARCGRCFWADGDWTAIKNTIVIREQPDQCDLRFLYQIVNDARFWPISGGAQPFIGLKNARNAKVKLPSLHEQQRVAEVLNVSDSQIADLVHDITKLRTEKKALMQQLLTGKRRVVV